VKPPATLAALFARYFVQTMVVQFVLLLGFVTLLIFLTSGADRDRIQQQMDGTVRMIQRQLLSQEPARRPAELTTINELFTYPIRLLPAIPASRARASSPRLAGMAGNSLVG